VEFAIWGSSTICTIPGYVQGHDRADQDRRRVRVKILDAARIGLPVVGTSAAVGSLSQVFNMSALDDDEALISECQRLLRDPGAAVAAGQAIFEANREHWQGDESAKK